MQEGGGRVLSRRRSKRRTFSLARGRCVEAHLISNRETKRRIQPGCRDDHHQIASHQAVVKKLQDQCQALPSVHCFELSFDLNINIFQRYNNIL
ncbi:hypothetical protein AVEN_162248-1, partial [Araneus ventricosus]